jgi:hypothetical protein
VTDRMTGPIKIPIIPNACTPPTKTIARDAERQRRRDLLERINGIRKRGLPPTIERAAREWQASRTHVQPKTVSIATDALKHRPHLARGSYVTLQQKTLRIIKLGDNGSARRGGRRRDI